MQPSPDAVPAKTAADWMTDAFEYGVDGLQRAVLFLEVLRERGNIYMEHMRSGKPPVLSFSHETVMDGRGFDRPVNYALARIIPEEDAAPDPEKRPIVVIDPRAGHGPGIGGSKRDSQVGFALKNGHPVYFVFFYPQPMPGQTIADVKTAEARFVQEVSRRHPGASEPAVIGNCQAGWAVALLGAERPDVTGPLVLNGAPLSYWAGVKGRNPMRYRGGLLGGVWLASFLNDLGNGRFDGAHLVAGFEDLNPANTYWTKQYNLWANIDTEAPRYLNFEKWWNGYFFMTADEMHFIVDNLFVGNKLEQGQVELGKGRRIDLKNLEDPVVVFASSGDNITPPQQALNWIMKAYDSVDEIRRLGQVIVYRVHEDIGHLGIFVSGRVARKEHNEIIRSIDLVEYLAPGLYEMVIEDAGEKAGVTDYEVRFEERTFAHLAAFDDGAADEAAFYPVARVSEVNDTLYNQFPAPWVRMVSSEWTAECLRQTHPLRMSRYGFSDMNPWMLPVRLAAPIVKDHRRPVSGDNLFCQAEKAASENIRTMLDLYRDIRDAGLEALFYAIYENPFMQALFPTPEAPTEKQEPSTENRDADDRNRWLAKMEEGGFVEGVVRIMTAMAGADKILNRNELETYDAVRKSGRRLGALTLPEFRERVKTQSRIIQTDPDRAIASLDTLFKNKLDRRSALRIARRIALSDRELAPTEEKLLKKIRAALKL